MLRGFVDKTEQEELSDVLSAIRKMVGDETRAEFSDKTKPQAKPEKAKPKPTMLKPSQRTLPAKIFVLQPYMRVNQPKPDVRKLNQKARVRHAHPDSVDESFAVAHASVDEGLLRDIVREVVQEQLRGELGKEIISAVKLDMIQLLENKT